MSIKVLIDPGHGGNDSGAVGPSHLRESGVVLAIAKLVHQGFDQCGFTTFLTRISDDTVSLARRVEIAREVSADIFLSIHANAASDSRACGFEVFTSPGYTKADPIACAIFDTVRQRFPGLHARVDTSDGDVDKEANFYVLVHTPMPAVLVETAFISNPAEEALLADPGWRLAMAGAIVTGVRGAVDPR